MNQKERVNNALKGIESDIPIDFGGNPVTGIHCSVVEQLRAYYGLNKEPVRIQCPYQMLGVIEDDLREAMGIDTIPFWSDSNMFGTSQDDVTEWETPWGQNVLISRALSSTRDLMDHVWSFPKVIEDVIPLHECQQIVSSLTHW